MIEQEQIQVNRTLTEYEHPGLGRVRQPRPAAIFEATPVNTEQMAAKLGEHGEEILEQAGFSRGEILEFKADGVLGGD